MPKKRILFVDQELAPYLSGEEADFSRNLAQTMHLRGREVRIFMPKFGTVNERRNQLHEVIRLSGMNISINDSDRPLIVKVASLQPYRLQVYFIDSDDFFQKSDNDIDAVGSNRTDNDERAIFYAIGTSETVKKLRWEAAAIQCTGWMSAITLPYLRAMLPEISGAEKTKLIYCITPSKIAAPVDPTIVKKLAEGGIKADFKRLGVDPASPNTDAFHKLGIANADALIVTDPDANPELIKLATKKKLKILPYEEASKGIDVIADFIDKISA